MSSPSNPLGAAQPILDEPKAAFDSAFARAKSLFTPSLKTPPTAGYADRVKEANDSFRGEGKNIQVKPSGKTPVTGKALKPIPRKRG